MRISIIRVPSLAPDHVDDQLYNRILWLLLKGDVPAPVAPSHAALHALQSSK